MIKPTFLFFIKHSTRGEAGAFPRLTARIGTAGTDGTILRRVIWDVHFFSVEGSGNTEKNELLNKKIVLLNSNYSMYSQKR